METPEGKRLPATSSPDSAVQESPFLRFLSNLTPIQSEPYNRMVLETNLPGTPLVFTSPQIDQQRGTQFLRRTDTDAAVQIACQRIDCEAMPLSWPGHDFQSSSPSGYADDMTQLPECSTLDFSNVPTGRVYDASHETTMEAGSIVRDGFGQDMGWRSSNLVKCLEESKSLAGCRISKRHQVNQASNQLQLHGIRRHLQFEAALSMNTATNYNYSSCSNMQVPVPSLLETRIMSTYTQNNHESLCPPLSSFQEKYMRCQQNGGNFGLVVPFPCFGVQLNNIARSESGRSDELAGKQLVGHTNSQIDHRIPEDLLTTPVTMSQPIFHEMQSAHGQSQALHLASYEPYDTKALGAPVQCELQDLRDDGRLDPKSSDEVEILSQNSSKGSKKRLPSGSESEECKRCNCKRSKCLKLYCDCFAAGVYCVGSCACENCMNKPENDDMILETRHQIEQRNPLAFAPKIVDTGSELSENALDNKSWSTPSSARHKRGCNCKKSKCLKKYCECYQANVGCSDGCRCEDCRNTFGKKQGFIEIMSQAKRLKYLSQKTQSAEAMSDRVKNDTTNQSPPTYEESVDTKQGTQWSDPHSKVLVSSSASNARNHGQTAIKSRNRSERTPEKENRVPNDAIEAGFSSHRDGSETQSFSHSRKNLILKSMPSFPPLTPYSNSKAGDGR